ncbi:MAG: crossover junction endodeoxyribonuclease RuvC [Coriobacteriales bacterium]|jgi:crossover junction endodeoxyribonuclease RuvC|nr:crossover junction endodeoxyribonuclease RuvC [Coriobacteriales bacterium]
MSSSAFIVMGVDPGLAHTGWGIVEQLGSRRRALAYGCVATTPDEAIADRLRRIHDEISAVIRRYHPVELGIEAVYFGSNAKSALATGEARGAALVAAACQQIQVGEYSPTQIKQLIVGTGTATKEQVQYMVKAMLGLDHTPTPDHAADALAVAICHAQLRRLAYDRIAQR